MVRMVELGCCPQELQGKYTYKFVMRESTYPCSLASMQIERVFQISISSKYAITEEPHQQVRKGSVHGYATMSLDDSIPI